MSMSISACDRVPVADCGAEVVGVEGALGGGAAAFARPRGPRDLGIAVDHFT